MSEYKRLDFRKHPSIATELVKFLAINTSFEAIEKLTATVASLKNEASKTKRKLTSAKKVSSLAANEADKAKRLVNRLTKRVGKLE